MSITRIVSSTLGRTRFKLPPQRRTPKQMAQLASRIEDHPDVHDVQFNALTGSILVHHNSNDTVPGEIKDVLDDLGCVFANVTGASEFVSFQDRSGAKLEFNHAIADLNTQVLAITHGIVNLQYILPLGLAGLALLQFLTFGWQFELVPWYILAYFAVDSFMKLNANEELEA